MTSSICQNWNRFWSNFSDSVCSTAQCTLNQTEKLTRAWKSNWNYFSTNETALDGEQILLKMSIFTSTYINNLSIHPQCLTSCKHSNKYRCNTYKQQTQPLLLQPFYGPLFGTIPGSAGTGTNIHPLIILISFFHLLRSIASSLFNLHAWQSFCTTSLQTADNGWGQVWIRPKF